MQRLGQLATKFARRATLGESASVESTAQFPIVYLTFCDGHMSLKSAIRAQLEAVASNKLAPWDVERWLTPKSWTMFSDASKDDLGLIVSLQNIFARYDYLGVDEDELKRELAAVAARLAPPAVFISFRLDAAPDDWRVQSDHGDGVSGHYELTPPTWVPLADSGVEVFA